MAMVIPSERPPGQTTLDIRVQPSGLITEVHFLPSNNRIREAGVKLDEVELWPQLLMTFDHKAERFAIYPFKTRPEENGTFRPKPGPFRTIWFDWRFPEDAVDEGTVESALNEKSDAFQVDPDYGLGIKQGYRHILTALTEFTDSPVLYIGDGVARGTEFVLPETVFRSLTREINRIDSRAKTAENEIKGTTAYNMLAKQFGGETRPFKLGRNEVRNLIQSYASDPNFTDPSIQEELVMKVAKAASTFAERNPEATDQLVSDLQLTRLESAIHQFEALMAKNHNENRWQKFFEADPFLLSFAFGYPVSIVNGQCYVGGRRIDGKGEKIGDFLFKNSVSNNAALIEIKKPHTKLLKEYRDDVFVPHDELSGGITQVLDQRYHLTSNFAQHMKDNEWWGDNALADFEVDCVLIAGQMPESKAECRSFQLYRKNSHGVQIVTFDEMLQSLKQVLAYIKNNSE